MGVQGFRRQRLFSAIPALTAWGLGDLPKDAELALKAGVDMDMASGIYLKYLPELAAPGKNPRVNDQSSLPANP